MGFGFVFLGSLLFFNIPYHSYTDVFAVALMLFGLFALSPYAKGFAGALRVGIPYFLLSLSSFFLAILKILFLAPSPMLISALTAAGLLFKFFFLWLFFMGVDEVARQTDIPKLRAHALRARFLTPIFCAMGILLEVGIFADFSVFLKYYLLGYLLFGVLYAFLCSKTVYECYILICYEGDENMDAPRRNKERKDKR